MKFCDLKVINPSVKTYQHGCDESALGKIFPGVIDDHGNGHIFYNNDMLTCYMDKLENFEIVGEYQLITTEIEEARLTSTKLTDFFGQELASITFK